jgi:hypothetical protein
MRLASGSALRACCTGFCMASQIPVTRAQSIVARKARTPPRVAQPRGRAGGQPPAGALGPHPAGQGQREEDHEHQREDAEHRGGLVPMACVVWNLTICPTVALLSGELPSPAPKRR